MSTEAMSIYLPNVEERKKGATKKRSHAKGFGFEYLLSQTKVKKMDLLSNPVEALRVEKWIPKHGDPFLLHPAYFLCDEKVKWMRSRKTFASPSWANRTQTKRYGKERKVAKMTDLRALPGQRKRGRLWNGRYTVSLCLQESHRWTPKTDLFAPHRVRQC